ncbi:hypothetical protein KAFR_0B01290 [Kazachstania africana CBS 2517]|uniref:Uncharacterized protein n=1 Tax=Kazachstania africana (strain ATCC 22294 / BCRC 22015 / CBS 2517 / CECT 1963 / NBRC 1671 / NRRL Y-8276) TaxID=1071382 RepID=H2APX8_KAZAF|nr:hypothetical protein KAFR_0B01290 [Kazachstania africana CBS 2517]CCF56428.1 hypothetical protein KAFR_0B01290 [Kazachstania africana CBS 2517]
MCAVKSPAVSAKDVGSAISSRDGAGSCLTSVTDSNLDANTDDFSMKAVYELDPSEMGVSRSISRCSLNSAMSMTATKDGVEGSKFKRDGIPQYSLNLLNSMNYNGSSSSITNKKKHHDLSDLSNLPPMTLREKMKLLNNDKQLSAIDSLDSLLDQNKPASELSRSEVDSTASVLGGDDLSYIHAFRSPSHHSITSSLNLTS